MDGDVSSDTAHDRSLDAALCVSRIRRDGDSEDQKGNLVSRDICRFNQFGDVRVCTDWDSGITIREMKDSKGDWYKVGDE
jgi:hypothetical protein